MQNPSTKAWLLLITLSLIWGSSFILIKRGLVGLSAQEVGALRIASASVFLFPVAIQRLKRVIKKHWIPLISIGFLGSLIPSFLFAFAQTQMDSSVTGVINALTPLFTVLIGWIIYKQKQRGVILGGVFLGFNGCAFLSMAGANGSLQFNAYALLVVLATVCYGLNINIIKYHLDDLKALTVTAVSLAMAGPIAISYLGFETDYFSSLLTDKSVQIASVYVAILGILGTAIALIIFNKLVQITSPVFASSVTYLIPIVAVIWGIIDNENLYLWHYIGMGLILFGVYITNRTRLQNNGN